MQTRTVTKTLPLKARTSGSLILKPRRGYYTGKATKKAPDGDNEIFNIGSVICGDGQRAKNGMALRNIVIYASDRIDGGVESYYEVDPETLMLTTVRASEEPRADGSPAHQHSRKRGKTKWIQRKLRAEALKWLYQNRGCALSIGGPGERTDIAGVDQHLVRDFRTVFQKQNDGNCMTAAITNAIEVVSGREIGEAMREYFFEENPHYDKIREATLLFHDLRTGAEMRLIPKKDHEIFNANRFAYLASREDGVYVVHVFQPKVASHTLVIDANRKLIIDSAEDFPMRLSEELLRKCGGDQAKHLRVGEVRMIVRQNDSQKNH